MRDIPKALELIASLILGAAELNIDLCLEMSLHAYEKLPEKFRAIAKKVKSPPNAGRDLSVFVSG